VATQSTEEHGQQLSFADKAGYLKSLIPVARSIYPNASALRLAKKTALFCKNGLQHKDELEHLRSLFECQELEGVLNHFPSILEKPFHPYACIDWDINRRFAEIEDHFTTYQCEGSIGLRLCDSEKREVYALSFHLSGEDTNACYISGLQGPNDRIPDRQKTIVTITRSLNGLRPKSLMVETVYMIANAMGIQRINGIANSGHIVQSNLYSDEKRALVEFDYDELWDEYQATSEADRFFQLPAYPVRKDIQSLKSKKRSLYRKRYAWLSDQTEAVRVAMNAILVEERQMLPPAEEEFDKAA